MATLPSVVAAEKFWRGEPGAVPALLSSMGQRAAIVAVALLLAGERKRVLRYTLAVTLGIEVVVLAKVKSQLKDA